MLKQFVALAEREPQAVALIDGSTGAVVTRSKLLELSAALATELSAAGVTQGDLVAVQLPNSAAFIATFLAALRNGYVVVPIDRDAPDTEVAAIVAHFGVRALVYLPDRTSDRVAITTREVREPALLEHTARLIKLTSGSTGRPKGIVVSEMNLVADCTNICTTMDIRPMDRNFGAIPFSHSYGFSNLVTPLLLRGTQIVISNEYLPQSILSLCNRYRCTVFPGIPMIFDHLASTPVEDGVFETVHTFISAGAPLQAATSRRFRERFAHDVHSFYGCSECGGISYDRRGGAVEAGHVGSAMENVSLTTENGRLVIASSAVARGYLHDAASFESFGGVFVADDLAEITEDGTVRLTGRAGDMINTAGKKVNPREIEQVILQLEGVRQVKVYGEPAGARGEVVAAAVVGNPDLTREQVREFCRARLSLHKVPRIVKLIDAIPVDERGKVRRALLAQL
jgi:long-chain acyl-CoA synthetase